jgi:hypothetical protein
MDIHITLGELETKNFGNTQDSLRRNHMLYFVMVRAACLLTQFLNFVYSRISSSSSVYFDLL